MMRMRAKVVMGSVACLTAGVIVASVTAFAPSWQAIRAQPDGSSANAYVDSLQNTGERADRINAERAARRYLNAVVDTGSLPKSLAGRTRRAQAAYNDSAHTEMLRLEMMSQLTTRRIARSIVDANRIGVDENFSAQSPDSLNYWSAQFVVSKVRGIEVRGDNAIVLLRGHFLYRTLAGSDRKNDQQQSRVSLRRSAKSGSKWIVVKESSSFDPDDGNG